MRTDVLPAVEIVSAKPIEIFRHVRSFMLKLAWLWNQNCNANVVEKCFKM